MVAILTISKIIEGKIFMAPDYEQWKKKNNQATEAV
jgi:hypothetical protein